MTDTTKALSHGSTFAVEQVRWPTTYRLAAVLALVLAMVAARCWVVVHSDFETDEPYYWLWSHGLAWGYFDHPPMIAYFIRLGTRDQTAARKSYARGDFIRIQKKHLLRITQCR